jgi:hypothetical protein
MPRASTRPEIILALSPSATARALGIRYERIMDAIDAGQLVVRQVCGKKRIPVFGPRGVQEFFDGFPEATRKVPR